jgi:hypothetical protein
MGGCFNDRGNRSPVLDRQLVAPLRMRAVHVGKDTYESLFNFLILIAKHGSLEKGNKLLLPQISSILQIAERQ